MASRFNSGLYEPELVKIMGQALDDAWATFNPPPRNTDLARQMLATAIIDAVDAGSCEPTALTRQAIKALKAALRSPVLAASLGGRRKARAMAPREAGGRGSSLHPTSTDSRRT